MMVLAPSTVQEAVDLTYAAFDYADRDMNPVLLLADGVIGTMMEPVELPEMKTEEEIAAIKEGKKKWACIGHELDYANRSWIQPGQWDTKKMQEYSVIIIHGLLLAKLFWGGVIVHGNIIKKYVRLI